MKAMRVKVRNFDGIIFDETFDRPEFVTVEVQELTVAAVNTIRGRAIAEKEPEAK